MTGSSAKTYISSLSERPGDAVRDRLGEILEESPFAGIDIDSYGHAWG
jgi:hypothetical protein